MTTTARPAAFALRHWIRGPLGRRLVLLGITSMALGGVEIWRLELIARLVGSVSQPTAQGASPLQLALLIAVFCVVQPMLYLSVVYLRRVSIEVRSYTDVAKGFFEAIMSLPFHVLSQRSTGTTLDYSRSYPGSIMSLGTVVISDSGYFLAFLGMLGFILINSSSLLMLPVIFWIVSLLTVGLLSYRGMDTLAGHAIAAAGELSGTKADFLENLPLIKTAGNDTFHLRAVATRFDVSRDQSGKVARRATFLLAAVNTVNGVTITMGIVILHFLYVRGQANLTLFVFFVPVMLQLAAISEVAMGSISKALVAIGQLKTIRNSYVVASFTPGQKVTGQSGDIQGENLQLTYPHSDGPVIDGAEFRFPKGARIGISAPSGTGKTTFLMAVAGLLPVNTGRLTLGAPHDRTALCTQDPHILQATIEENLLFGAAIDGFDRINTVLDMVELSQFTVPDQRSRLIAPHGAGLSGGQKQRLSLARAILSRPDILLLDEALSGLDEHQERRILRRLDKELPDTTILISSHRPSSLSHCTAFYTIENGRIMPAFDQAKPY